MSVRISVKHINDKYKLYTKSDAGENPAGNRLARGDPLPNDRWEYDSEFEAKEAARKLQLYIDQYERKRKKTTRKNKRLEEQEEKLREHFALHNAASRQA
tara:strand:- start:25215 stop:25514 length:300 start_codon:yes stop_codon:yes gene_type:complete